MENDLIRRGDAITQFQKQYIDTQEGTDHVAIRINIGVTKCIHAMQDIPAVDAVEVRHGRWKQNDNGTWLCSECSSWIEDEQHHYARFCLHCGAKIDREEEHNEAD